MKRLVIGMTAHVDSGKTTLAEAMLYCSGEIRKLGRVDHGDAFLDTHIIEKNRGITVFSKQALMHFNGDEYTLLDTPGHTDFSAETERAFAALDIAVLVISGTDGVQSHTETLWSLLRRYSIPVIIFVNKTDISHKSREELLNELKKRLSDKVTDFSDTSSDAFYDSLALCSEDMMNEYLENGSVSERSLSKNVMNRNVFPCIFGSALKIDGIKELLDIISRFTLPKEYGSEFGGRVYKITTEGSTRLTHIKITGGSLKVRTALTCGKDAVEEKINQIRIYSGKKFVTVDEAFAGSLCAVTGLTAAYAGEGLGTETDSAAPVLEPVLNYRVSLPDGTDPYTAMLKMKTLEEEDPQLHILWNERSREIYVSLMGEIQLEILKTMISERFGIDVSFDNGSISYKETIMNAVEGVGHYEPLRHYAEAHILMEPLPAGSGIVLAADCNEEKLARNWQRLILTHLAEKTHVGVLTGSPITDIKLTVVGGRAHLKHTEGGDFRQATYRAVRMGLRCAESVLLEPYYSFRLEIPDESLGRALNDLQKLDAEFTAPEKLADCTVICGSAPVSSMRGYHTDVAGYTKGRGRLSCTLKGYYPCKNADEVIERIGYDCDSDLYNTADSVFCAHGAGFAVKWNEVTSYMHVPSCMQEEKEEIKPLNAPVCEIKPLPQYDDKELMAIFERTYGKIKRDERSALHTEKEKKHEKEYVYKPSPQSVGPEYLLVDGYNIIFAWDELNRMAQDNLELARQTLINAMCNYRGFHPCELILVFDAYRIKGNPRSIETVNNITVVYTKEAETADMYIEKVTHELGKKHRVRVATSDRLEQIIILGGGAARVSATEFHEEVLLAEKQMREMIETSNAANSFAGKIERNIKNEQ